MAGILAEDDAHALLSLMSEGTWNPNLRLSITEGDLLRSPRFRDCTGTRKGRLEALCCRDVDSAKQIGVLQASILLDAGKCTKVLLQKFGADGSCADSCNSYSMRPVSALEEAAYQHDQAALAQLLNAGAELKPQLRRVLTMLFAGLYPPWHEFGVKAGSKDEKAVVNLTRKILALAAGASKDTRNRFICDAFSTIVGSTHVSCRSGSWQLAAASVPASLKLMLDAADDAEIYGAQKLLLNDDAGFTASWLAAAAGCVEGVDLCIKRSILIDDKGKWLVEADDANSSKHLSFQRGRSAEAAATLVVAAAIGTIHRDRRNNPVVHASEEQGDLDKECLRLFGRPHAGETPPAEFDGLFSLRSLRMLNHGYERLGARYMHCKHNVDFSGQCPMTDEQLSNSLTPEGKGFYLDSPVCYCVLEESEHAIEALLRMGARVCDDDVTPMIIYYLDSVARNDQPDAAVRKVTAMLAAGASPSYQEWTQWESKYEGQDVSVKPLHLVIGGSEELLALLISASADPWDTHGDGVTAFEFCVMKGDFASLAAILKHIPPQSLTFRQPKTGATLLHLLIDAAQGDDACRNMKRDGPFGDCVELLLQQRSVCDVRAVNGAGQTALQRLIYDLQVTLEKWYTAPPEMWLVQRLIAAGTPLIPPSDSGSGSGDRLLQSCLLTALTHVLVNKANEIMKLPLPLLDAVITATLAVCPDGRLPSDCLTEIDRLWETVLFYAAPSSALESECPQQAMVAALVQTLIAYGVPVEGSTSHNGGKHRSNETSSYQPVFLALALCPGAARHMIAAGADISQWYSGVVKTGHPSYPVNDDTALHAAARSMDLDLIQFVNSHLEGKGVHVADYDNARNSAGLTALEIVVDGRRYTEVNAMQSFRNNRRQLCFNLVEKWGADGNNGNGSATGRTPLSRLMFCGSFFPVNASLVKLFLSHGADPMRGQKPLLDEILDAAGRNASAIKEQWRRVGPYYNTSNAQVVDDAMRSALVAVLTSSLHPVSANAKHFALLSSSSDAELASLLIKCGASPTTPYDRLLFGDRSSLLARVVASGDIATLRALMPAIQSNSSVAAAVRASLQSPQSARSDDPFNNLVDGWPQLFNLPASDNVEWMSHIMALGLPIDTSAPLVDSLLRATVLERRATLVRWLLDRGADANQRETLAGAFLKQIFAGPTLLHLLILSSPKMRADAEATSATAYIAKLLVAYGASPASRSTAGWDVMGLIREIVRRALVNPVHCFEGSNTLHVPGSTHNLTPWDGNLQFATAVMQSSLMAGGDWRGLREQVQKDVDWLDTLDIQFFLPGRF